MNVEFDSNNSINQYKYQPKKFSLTNLIIKIGLAKDEAGARKLMVIIAIICFTLSIYFFYQI